ncbi:hypothetical protein TUM19329_01530 [Legionella antarctica]|uniref:Uncharacterized protein n=1 Tax=Legionella antarctica TaxID=2708020 RepID=A0A6F8T1A2_9GAMM|nr:hypothetical protein [Legionella antarctica]BCA93792.1 hypothetical protein TUM19329_01530 [Legionella antarctica]
MLSKSSKQTAIQDHDKLPNQFKQEIIHNSVLATNNFKAEHFDLKEATKTNQEGLEALNAKDGLQSMLAAQMLSVHKLQQRAMTYANNCNNQPKIEQYYTNAAIKLTNCFVQQANMLAKLQGIGGQKITVERVEVHQGGQAIVGNIQGGYEQ